MDIWRIPANGLWILGLAILLAVLSWAYWTSGVERACFRAVLGRPPIQRVTYLALAVFCAGLAAIAQTWWKWVFWGLVATAWALQAWREGRSKSTLSPQ